MRVKSAVLSYLRPSRCPHLMTALACDEPSRVKWTFKIRILVIQSSLGISYLSEKKEKRAHSTQSTVQYFALSY